MNFYKFTTAILTGILLANSFMPSLLPDTARAATNTINCITVGAGLKPGGQQCTDFKLAVKFTPKSAEHGTSSSVARGDHNHDSRYWMLIGNAATTPGTNFLGTTDAQALVFKTNATERARITSDGKVGIGTSNPQSALTVVGTTSAGVDVKGLRYGGIFTATNTSPTSIGLLVTASEYGVKASINTASGGTGVYGESQNGNGVFGNSQNGHAVHGDSQNGSAVFGTSQNAFAMNADGNTKQTRTKGGWIKAMARIGGNSPYVGACFNSQINPLANPPVANCGITVTKNGTGDYSVNFGFQVTDRLVSITPEYAASGAIIPTFYFDTTSDNNTVRVRTYSGGTTLVDSAFHIVVY